MIKAILNTENQAFIKQNNNANTASLLLKSNHNISAPIKALIEQIEARKKCQTKLPTWFNTPQIYYPNKLNVEQTSSEITAQFKATLINGKTLIDLTGGFGVDCVAFSKTFKQVTYCEINSNLSRIFKHNLTILNIENINCINSNGVTFIKNNTSIYDCIYIDPSRRNDAKGKVFMLKDCLPNVPEHLGCLLEKSTSILIKPSPLLDISIGLSELKHVKNIIIIAVKNEVKELLWLIEKNYNKAITVKTINIKPENNQLFEFKFNDEKLAEATYSLPLTYLYEPNAALLKSGAFKNISETLKISKLHKHAHLYTNDNLIEFPGRRFKIEAGLDYNKKQFKKFFKHEKANVTTRHFPESVANIRKKFNLKDGGKYYLFFTTNCDNKKIILITTKY